MLYQWVENVRQGDRKVCQSTEAEAGHAGYGSCRSYEISTYLWSLSVSKAVDQRIKRIDHTLFTSRISRDSIAFESVLQVALARASRLGDDGCLDLKSVIYYRRRTIHGRKRQPTLTAMMYAMVAKVVRPALTSRRKVAPRISFGYNQHVLAVSRTKRHKIRCRIT
jgi:hypothetical protein